MLMVEGFAKIAAIFFTGIKAEDDDMTMTRMMEGTELRDATGSKKEDRNNGGQTQQGGGEGRNSQHTHEETLKEWRQ
jgi:hypothetical protein